MSAFMVYDADQIVDPALLAGSLGVGAWVAVPRTSGYVDPGPSGYAVVRRCWDGEVILRGPITAADVSAIGSCSVDPAVTERAWVAETLDAVKLGSTRDQLLIDAGVLRSYLAIASPTAAQRLTMERALVRVVAAMARFLR